MHLQSYRCHSGGHWHAATPKGGNCAEMSCKCWKIDDHEFRQTENGTPIICTDYRAMVLENLPSRRISPQTILYILDMILSLNMNLTSNLFSFLLTLLRSELCCKHTWLNLSVNTLYNEIHEVGYFKLSSISFTAMHVFVHHWCWLTSNHVCSHLGCGHLGLSKYVGS